MKTAQIPVGEALDKLIEVNSEVSTAMWALEDHMAGSVETHLHCVMDEAMENLLKTFPDARPTQQCALRHELLKATESASRMTATYIRIHEGHLGLAQDHAPAKNALKGVDRFFEKQYEILKPLWDNVDS